MALVLRVGYEVVTALNQSTVAQIGMWASGANTALILGFWILAAVSPLWVFSQTGQMKGFAAGMLGASLPSGSMKEQVQNAKDRIPDASRNAPPNVTETTDINDGKNEGEVGGPLPGGDGSDKPSMLDAGTEPEQTDGPELPGPGGGGIGADAGAGSTSADAGSTGSTTSTSGRTTNTASGGESTSGTTTSSDAASENMVSSEDVTEVNHPSDLPTESNYQVGRVKDNGEFQLVAAHDGLSRSALLSGTYNRLNRGTEKYEDEKLLLQSQEDGSFYDMDSMTHREQSYEQMSKDTSEDVLNS